MRVRDWVQERRRFGQALVDDWWMGIPPFVMRWVFGPVSLVVAVVALPLGVALLNRGKEAHGGTLVAAALFFGLAGSLLSGPRRVPKRKEEHNVEVHDVRPSPDRPEDFEPYFVALCDCDWMGDIRSSSEEAFRDAHGHSPNVSEDVQRPVG